ncbi:MAG: hypothetical protein GC147_10840 [Porphyrobacter sp.]|nr:hypothetical protein [Porphyrobacter sp.]
MWPERAFFAGHGCAALLALGAALAWPRVGEAAVLVPLGTGRMSETLAWAEAERAPVLGIDTGRARVIARIPSNHSLWRALARGIVPVAARSPGCGTQRKGRKNPWKN